MSDKNQSEYSFPKPGDNSRKSSAFLPRFFRSEANNKFLQATLDQLIQPGVAEKVNGYFGRRVAKAFKASDNYVDDVSALRTNYQFEPSVVIKNDLDNVTFYKDYIDYINQIDFLGGKSQNHSRLNSQDTYAWDPHVDYDKFVNFREYYWAPNGPLSIPVRGQSREVVSTYTVTTVEEDDNTVYVFNDGLEKNPRLTLYRGHTYRFEINAPGHPIAFALNRSFLPGEVVIVAGREGIRSSGLYDSQLYGNEYDLGDFIVQPSSGSVSFKNDGNVSTIYDDGITKENEEGEELATVYVEQGVIEFTIPLNAPENLYYISKNSVDTSGQIKVNDLEENTFLDVENEILGKKTYLDRDNVQLSNGMKLRFIGDVEPKKYSSGEWYVEGVGDKIVLISESDLIVPTAFSQDDFVPFDSQGFDRLPFSNSSAYPKQKDYHVINRASKDRNPWSRFNRWFHKSVLEQSFLSNNLPVDIDETQRAKRPILEFEAGLKLFNYGTEAKKDIDLIDTFTKDVFSDIEGSFGYIIDDVELVQGMRVLFSADTDIRVNGKIYEVNFVTLENTPQIYLKEVEDSEPLEFETVFVVQGNTNAGKTFHYHENTWIEAQEKTGINQCPLFDLCCPEGNFYGDVSVFDSPSFKGTKIFSYRQGTGVVDPELGFPLTYKNIDNTGDIVFDFNLLSDEFTIQNENEIVLVKTNTANLRKYKTRLDFVWVNGWSSKSYKSIQRVVRQYVANKDLLNNFEIDVYDNAGDLNDLRVIVHKNNKLQTKDIDYEIDRFNSRAFVRFYQNCQVDDNIVIKSKSSTTKNQNGYYEFPINFERNPLNEDITEFTLGEVIDHVSSIVEELNTFDGVYPGLSNLRDLSNVGRFGKKFVKHSGPLNLPLYHLTSKTYNIDDALDFAKKEYTRFKRNFVETATNLGFDGNSKDHVDTIMQNLTRNKNKSDPFYFSDMLGFVTSVKTDHEIIDPDFSFFALSQNFDLDKLSNQSVNVYLNEEQLIYGIDYEFNDEGFVVVSAEKNFGDTLTVYEYENTDSSYIPPTPTKIGLYPKWIPQVIVDDTYVSKEPEVAGPFKIYAQTENGDLGWYYPVYTDKKSASQADSQHESELLQFVGMSRLLYIPKTDGITAARDERSYDEFPVGVAFIQGHDGSRIKCYQDYRDKLLLELEKRIYNNIKIDYENSLLDIDDYVGGKFRKTDFSRSEINDGLIRDFSQWLEFVEFDYTENDFYQRTNQFTFNYSSMTSTVDGESLPGFWRGIYFDAFDTDRPHTHPWEMLGFRKKPTWWNKTYGPAPYTSNNLILWQDLEEGKVREPGKQVRIKDKYTRPGLTTFIPVDSQGKLKSPIQCGYAQNFFYRNTSNNFKFGDEAPTESAWRKSSEYPFSLIKSWLLNQPAYVFNLGFDVSRTVKNLAGQYVYKDTLEPISSKELVFPNTFEDSERKNTSGFVNYIYNLVASNILTVYDDYKTQVSDMTVQMALRVAGFTDKSKFQLLLDSKSPRENINDEIFVPEENYQVFLNTSSPIDSPLYSGLIIEKRSNGFVVRGYDDTRPFLYYYDPVKTSNDITVNIGGRSEKSTEWSQNKQFYKGQIVDYQSQYYRVTENFTSGIVFANDNLAKLQELPIVGGRRATFSKSFDRRARKSLYYGERLDTIQQVIDFILGYGDYLESQGFDFNYFNREYESIENWDEAAREYLFWTTQGWAVGTTIALSPSSFEISFSRDYAVVDDIFDDYYRYSLKKSDGRALERKFSSVLREGNSFGIRTRNNDDGIYAINLPLVQKEHIVLLDNNTVFDDVIYEPSTGYRQERIRVLGYRADNWNGSLNIPGFVYDQAEITAWEEWQDYAIGSLVKYKQFYYVAKSPAPGTNQFNPTYWMRLNEKPEPQLFTNFDYRINQFTDFYDLDSDNFDAEQQRMAQHLIGYQKRDYLANIINDDVSQYKFYQGFIQDKGTRNAIEKLFNPLQKTQNEGLEFYEEWGLRLGQYGSVDDIKQIEFELSEDKFLENPQSIEFVKSIDPLVFDKVYRVLPTDMIDTPVDYDHSPFPTTTLKSYTIDTGYVHEDDIEYKAGSKQDLAETDVNLLQKGEYIWLTDNNKDNWTVYQLDDVFAKAESLEPLEEEQTEKGEPLFKIVFDAYTTSLINVGDFVAVKSAQDFNLNGFYEVYENKFNYIHVIVPENNDIIDFTEQSLSATKLRKTRFDTLDDANNLIQQNLYADQRVWIDNYKNSDWAVLENNAVYNLQQVVNNPDEDTNLAYASDITASDDNRDIFVSMPDKTDGEVIYYRRSRDSENLLKQQVIRNTINVEYYDPDKFYSQVGQRVRVKESGITRFYELSTALDDENIPLTDTNYWTEVQNEFNLFDPTLSKFGHSISVSQDGEFLAVGVPFADNVKTRFKGEFSVNDSYSKNDIVKFRESLWKANKSIVPGSSVQSFSSFESYVGIVENSTVPETDINLIVTGNPQLSNVNDTSHILIQAPKAQYDGSQSGDTITLYWNDITYANDSLEPKQPFNGTIPAITKSFLDQTHVISKKIDRIIKIDRYFSVPQEGDDVVTDTAAATVEYAKVFGNELLIYLSNISGILNAQDTINLNDDQNSVIGEYQEIEINGNGYLGGFWFIETVNYNNGTVFRDPGKGLVYLDYNNTTNSFYYNVADDIAAQETADTLRNKASYIENLSYLQSSNGAIDDYRWIIRVSNNTADGLTAGTEFNITLNNINQDIDFANTGFTKDSIEQLYTLTDKWDGFVEIEYNNFDDQGNPFEIQVGDIVSDQQTPFDQFGGFATNTLNTFTAEVVAVQTTVVSQKLYLKYTQGEYSVLDNIAKIEIQRNQESPARTVDRITGEIQDRDNKIVLKSSDANYQFLVITNIEIFEAQNGSSPVIDSEYWIHQEATVNTGVTIEPSIPTSNNKDYTQIFNVSADNFGQSSFVNQGAVALYRKDINGYTLSTVLSTEYADNNKQFGLTVKISKDDNLYSLFVSDKNGLIEIFRHGATKDQNFKGNWDSIETYEKGQIVLYLGDYYRAQKDIVTQNSFSINDSTLWQKISWKSAKDENYRGEWDNAYAYSTDAIVSYNENLYTALTNIGKNTASPEISSSWSILPENVEYLGRLPFDTTDAKLGETAYIPSSDFTNTIDSKFSTSADGKTVIVAEKRTDQDSSVITKLLVYRFIDDKFILDQRIESPTENTEFGDSIAVNPRGTQIAITNPNNDEVKLNQGVIYIYSLGNNGKFGIYNSETQKADANQILKSPNNESSEFFGNNLAFSNDNLVVTSLNGDMTIPTTFDAENLDENATTFDSGYTEFNRRILDSGMVYVFEILEGKIIYSESLRYDDATLEFGEQLFANQNHIYVGLPDQGTGRMLDYRKPKGIFAWSKKRNLIAPVDTNKIKGIFLYNKRTNQILTYLDYIDPIQGKIAGPAEQELSYKMGFDPATYNVGIGDSVSQDSYWGEEYTGKLWWYTRSAKFTYPYQGDIQYQKNNWNELQPGSFINVFEWVSSYVLPSQWDQIADTELGLQRGISGKTLYGDNFYSQKFEYDSVAKRFVPKYYFWAASKKTVPQDSVVDRKLSAFDVSRLIAQPRKEGYRFVSLLADNRLVLNNVESLIYNKDVVLNIKFTDKEEVRQNVHSQYQILSEGLETSLPHPIIESKWLDSLVGYDENDRPVPDRKLSVKQKYGILNRPRQTMFVNRIEALKQYIERVNIILKQNIVVDNYDISDLISRDAPPAASTNRYDETVEVYDELRFTSTNKIRKADLEPVIQNGKLIRVNIINPGRGYKKSPSYEIVGTGQNAEIELQIDNIGQVVSATVINQGSGYNENTSILVRRYAVLVQSDENVNGRWAIFQWDNIAKEWLRTSLQSYDVSRFWKYVDWYATGYNEFTVNDYTIDQSYKLTSLNDEIGDVVKIQNVGTGGWLLLEKINNVDSEDYTVNYKTIGRQNGTIQFTENLYRVSSNITGYDNRSFDSSFYDTDPRQELRIIFNTVKNKLFISDLKQEYNKLFFASLRYVLAEQQYVDWIFKTSFVKIKHNRGELDQDITFDADNVENYRAYVEEVKPFKSVIREFISAREKLEETNTDVTDFDLPPYYSNISKMIESNQSYIEDNEIKDLERNMDQYPRRNWLNNFGRAIKEIRIGDSGSGYTFPPIVKIQGGGGSGAEAQAYLGYGKITAIKITNPGKGYTSSPSVVIEGSQIDSGTPARAAAVLGEGVVRSPSIKIRFDRTSGKYYIEQLEQTETFTGTATQTVYNLEWPMQLSLDSVSVTVDNREVLRSEFEFENVENKATGYTREQGRITFAKPPVLDSEIVVTYKKPLSMLDAEDRIQFGYDPISGMLGKDLAQLMDGVDYGGVEITSFGFEELAGWDTDEWYSDTWDKFDESFEDYVFTFDGSTIAIDLREPLENNVVYNVYLNGTRLDDPNYGTSEQTNPDAVISSIVGNGTQSVIDLDELGITVVDNDVMIIRKSTSDGSFTPRPESYDMALSGGNLFYDTATGLAPEDIIVDGDGFVTATTSKGPEELVPGQLVDSLDIQVFTKGTSGTGNIYSQNHRTDGTTTTFDLGVIPSSSDAVIVKIDNKIISSDQYTIDWNENTLTIDTVDANKHLSILTISASVQNFSDLGKIVADGSTTEYLIDSEYQKNYSVFITVDGENVVYQAFVENGKLLVIFEVAPEIGSVIYYTVFDKNTVVNYSQVTKDIIITDGSSSAFELSEAPFYAEPLTHNVLVIKNNKVLSPGYNLQFTIPATRQREYQIETFQYPVTTLQADEIEVYINGKKLTSSQDWLFNFNNNSIRLDDTVGFPGDILEIYVIKDREYDLDNKTLTLTETPEAGETIEVYKFSNHDLLDIERINYDILTRTRIYASQEEENKYLRLNYGEIELRSPAKAAQYVWVALNGELLSPNVDYYLTENRTKVKLTNTIDQSDTVDIFQITAPTVSPKFAFRQFKDMLNRTHFKRLDTAETVLAKDLGTFDIRIEVENASLLDDPDQNTNQPGIVWIDGERIEYFDKKDNTLRQLRRGTLGTGVKSLHGKGTLVYDQGITKTIPYNDRTLITIKEGDGSTDRYALDYDISSVEEIEIFVGGRRLRKNNVDKFDKTLALDSPTGDITIDPEFTLVENSIVFDIQDQNHPNGVPLPLEQIRIIRKIGKIWESPNESLSESQTDIAFFLRAGR